MPIVNPTAETHPERFGYRLPEMPFIGGHAARYLVVMEQARDENVQACAIEMSKLFTLDLWTEALPEALAALLEHYDTHAADAAAIAYLRKRGYQIVDKTEGF